MNLKCRTISVEEAGIVLGIHRSLAYRLVRDGKIPVLRLGRKIRVPLCALDRLLENPEALREVRS